MDVVLAPAVADGSSELVFAGCLMDVVVAPALAGSVSANCLVDFVTPAASPELAAGSRAVRAGLLSNCAAPGRGL